MARPLTRDMDLIRRLLLEIESGKTTFHVISRETAAIIGSDPTVALPQEEADRLELHLQLLEDAGFLNLRRGSAGIWQVLRITWAGYEFLETVRDGEVWGRVKAGAQKAGNASLALTWELAKAYGKKIAAERLGIDLS